MSTEAITALKTQTARLLAELYESKEPILITENGQPPAYLLDVANYQLMVEGMRILEDIVKGEQAIRDVRTMDATQAKEKMSKCLK